MQYNITAILKLPVSPVVNEGHGQCLKSGNIVDIVKDHLLHIVQAVHCVCKPNVHGGHDVKPVTIEHVSEFGLYSFVHDLRYAKIFTSAWCHICSISLGK